MAVTIAAAAQDPETTVHNFSITDGSVTWANVFEGHDVSSARTWFEENFTITKDDGTKMIGETAQNVLPYQQTGLKQSKVPALCQYPCVVYFTAEFKDDRYRVVVNRIVWSPQIGAHVGGLLLGIGTMDLNELALKKGQFTPGFFRRDAESINAMLEYMFKAKSTAAVDW